MRVSGIGILILRAEGCLVSKARRPKKDRDVLAAGKGQDVQGVLCLFGVLVGGFLSTEPKEHQNLNVYCAQMEKLVEKKMRRCCQSSDGLVAFRQGLV